jgi:hypothetical protein
MDNRQLLDTRIIPDYVVQQEALLMSIYNGTATHPLLTKETAEIGLLLLNKLPEYQVEAHYYSIVPIRYGDKRYMRLLQLLPESEWKDPLAYNLLMHFFGAEKAAYVRHAWEQFPYRMYQSGYTRRSFRSPRRRELYLPNQWNFLSNAILQVHMIQYQRESAIVCYDLNVTEQIRYDHFQSSTHLFYLWAAAIDLDNQEVFSVLEDIIFNKDAVGKVSRNIIKALLCSEKEAAWQLVEKLLLAAQRQEGLRQTVLEALDETSVGALKYMIKVLVDNKLTRFSSVVRAIDVWAGVSWETEKESAVNAFLEKAYTYLYNPALIPEAVKSKNNTEVYMALWAQGIYEVEDTLPYLKELLQDASAEKRCVAVKFVMEARHFQIDMPVLYKAVEDTDIAVLGMAVQAINGLIAINPAHYNTYYPALFDNLHAILDRIKVKEKTFQGIAFSWMNASFSRSEVLKAMLYLVLDKQERLDIVLSYFDEADLSLKELLAKVILPEHAGYYFEEKKVTKEITLFQRNFSFRILKERGESLLNAAFRVLESLQLDPEEMAVLQELLKRKSGTIRSKAIVVLLKQPDPLLIDVVGKLLQGDGEQRLAGLDIALQLQKQTRLQQELKTATALFKERKSISPKEEILLSQLTGDTEAIAYTVHNGYGLYNPAEMPVPALPVINPDDCYGKCIAQGEYGFSVPVIQIKTALAKLYNIFLEHHNFEYEVVDYDGSKIAVLLGNDFRRKQRYNHKYATSLEEYEDYPLAEVWDQWYKESGLSPRDLFLIHALSLKNDQVALTQWKELLQPYIPVMNDLLPKEMNEHYIYTWRNPVIQIAQALRGIYPFSEKNAFLIGACTRLFTSLPPEVLQYKPDRYTYNGIGWQDAGGLDIILRGIQLSELKDEEVGDCFQLFHWRQFSGLPENIMHYIPPLLIFCRAFQQEIISEGELYRGLISSGNMRALSTVKKQHQVYDYFTDFPFLKEMFIKVREHFLDIELKRGDSTTSVTLFVQELQSITGIHRFTDILAGLGKTTLHKGYLYTHGAALGKQELFSALLKRCQPLPGDTQELFNESIQQIKATDTQLLEAAVYAPQWQQFVSKYLDWKGLDAAIWWMHAHTKTSGYREPNSEAESEIARYTAVDLADFNDGAVDKAWFLKAYQELGKERWQRLYDAAKYISDGNAHRRARLYADVMTGDLKIKEVTQKVKEKRDQDYLRVYGLIPLSKANGEKDVLSRYEYLQQFKKESKQFGAQKQTSEGLAIRIAMENLARNAGYTDPVRLTWAMETKQVQSILSKETQVQYDDVLIGLIIDEDGQADVVSFKGDKPLKSIPPKYKKDKKVLELHEFKKTLRKQFRRSRKALEDAMVRGDAFHTAEISNLFEHPVISRHLATLVFVCEKGLGFYKNGTLVAADGTEITLATDDMIRIAHCTDLYASGTWSDYQRYFFDKQLQQPFKQVFRELYVPLEEELKEVSVSRRYAGHQVQPSQTVALLKTRGWKVDYEEGLQKVFHKEGFFVRMYAMANWFSPAEVESPVLETIVFHDLKSCENVAFKDIDPRIFSEVMRDIDLVVSVAHAGGVDPETSHSSIALRTVLLQETLRLFKLSNVTISGTHAKITGKHGEYSVHLGSAVVHQLPGRYISILPVHAQQRGRLFLPFADDDPKSAELISKVLLLARDHKIQDPTILQQLHL